MLDYKIGREIKRLREVNRRLEAERKEVLNALTGGDSKQSNSVNAVLAKMLYKENDNLKWLLHHEFEKNNPGVEEPDWVTIAT